VAPKAKPKTLFSAAVGRVQQKDTSGKKKKSL
jgi:hypothetical protein